MKLRIPLRPAIWSSVVVLHVAMLLATAWVQWRISGRAPDVLVTVAPAPPRPPRTAARSQPQPVSQSQRAHAAERVAVQRRRVATAARSVPRVAYRAARESRTTVETDCTVVEVSHETGTATAGGHTLGHSTGSVPAGRTLRDREASPLPGCVAPTYPRSARRAGHTGVVLLRVHLDAMGVVCRVTLERSAGRLALDRAALTAVRTWRFAPRVRSGVNVACELIQPVSFRLR